LFPKQAADELSFRQNLGKMKLIGFLVKMQEHLTKKALLPKESSAKVPFGESSVSKQAVFSLCTSMYTPQKPFVFP
jgi:hypothetical protein